MSAMIGSQIEKAKARVADAGHAYEQAKLALAALEEMAAIYHPVKPRYGQKMVMEVNGVEIAVGPKQAALIEILTKCNDTECVPTTAVAVIFGGTKSNRTTSIIKLRKKLVKCNADLVYFRGEGYRLQAMQEAA